MKRQKKNLKNAEIQMFHEHKSDLHHISILQAFSRLNECCDLGSGLFSASDNLLIEPKRLALPNCVDSALIKKLTFNYLCLFKRDYRNAV